MPWTHRNQAGTLMVRQQHTTASRMQTAWRTASTGCAPEQEPAELAGLYRDRGLSDKTAYQVARELTAHDAWAAHLYAELNIDQADIVSPWHAAFASAVAFTVGEVLSMLAILLPPAHFLLGSAGVV